jgi:4,5-DOPA dioxygenase extradiol
MKETPRGEARVPVLFIGHGSPLNAIEDNVWSRGFRAIGERLPRPRAVLAVSAHWWTEGSFLTGGDRPRTIHDFGGFPEALYEVQYPAPGSPELAARLAALLSGLHVEVREDWGLDHGTWSVMRHLFPAADVPVVQLSLDGRLSSAQHFELARSLGPLRGEGVLVLGSGNVVHNLADAMGRASRGELQTPDWAERFDRETAAALEERDTARLVAAWPDGRDARRAHPHPDHWFPLLYAYAATDRDDSVCFPIDGFDMGSLSMRAALWR